MLMCFLSQNTQTEVCAEHPKSVDKVIGTVSHPLSSRRVISKFILLARICTGAVVSSELRRDRCAGRQEKAREGMAARESSRSLGRVAAQPRTRPGRNARAPESEEESSEDGDSGEEQESDEAGDGLDGLQDRELLLEAVRSVEALKLAIRCGQEGHHEFKRLDNAGHCGICGDSGSRLACVPCRVRLCRDTDCWNQHQRFGRGNTMREKARMDISEDQGAKKSVPTRARQTQDGED